MCFINNYSKINSSLCFYYRPFSEYVKHKMPNNFTVDSGSFFDEQVYETGYLDAIPLGIICLSQI